MPKQLPLFSCGWMQITDNIPEEIKERAISELKNLLIEYFKMRAIKEDDNER